MSHLFATATLGASLCLSAAVSSAAAPVAPTAESHVRLTDPRLREILDTGMSKSATFRALVATLDESDVIVYVSLQLVRPGLNAYLVHAVAVSDGLRYLRVVLGIRVSDVELLGAMAHELQHAVEVSQASQVRSNTQLVRLFEEIGFIPSEGGSIRETRGAQLVEQRVRRELRARAH